MSNHKIINATRMGEHALRLIGTTDMDGKGTRHDIADIDPIVLFDFVRMNTGEEPPFRPHPHAGLTAMSFLPLRGAWMAWDSLDGASDECLEAGGLYYVHAGTPAFHHEFASPETVAAALDVEFIQLVWNATDEDDVKTVVIQPKDVPVVSSSQGTVRILAGDFLGAKAIQPFTHRRIIYAYLELAAAASMELPIPSGMRGMLFVIEGSVSVNGATIYADQMLIIDEEDMLLDATNPAAERPVRFVIAAGEPVNKPFFKLLGLGGFIIGETEQEVRSNMEALAETAEEIRQLVPEYFPAKYL